MTEDLMARIEALKTENEDLKTKNRALEAGYQAVNRTANALRTEHLSAQRRIAKLEKESADKRRLRTLEALAEEVDSALRAGLIDRMACPGIVEKVEAARGG